MTRPAPKYPRQFMIRLSDEQYDQLEAESVATNTAAVDIIRDAIRQRYEQKAQGKK